MARFMPETWPIPGLNALNRDFFSTGKLVVQECVGCGNIQHPPEEICFRCHGMDFRPSQTSGQGTVHSYIVVHHPASAAMREIVPYAVVLVALNDHPEVRVIGNLVNRAPTEVVIGQRVRAVFEEIEDKEAGVLIRMPQWEAI
jgi:uncharacterized OB-fold protein